MRTRRIAVDWDFKNEKDFLKFIRRIKRKKFKELTIKPTRKGYHVFVWTTTNGNRFKLREHFGDDKNHLAMDKLHRNARQTMFYQKKKWKRK